MEILDTMDPEEFARAVKREVVEYQGQWVVRLVYEDATVRYVRNLAVPVDDEAKYEYVDSILSAMNDLRCGFLKGESIPDYDGFKMSAEIGLRPGATWEEGKHTGNCSMTIRWIDLKLQAEYEQWKAERPDVEPED